LIFDALLCVLFDSNFVTLIVHVALACSVPFSLFWLSISGFLCCVSSSISFFSNVRNNYGEVLMPHLICILVLLSMARGIFNQQLVYLNSLASHLTSIFDN